MEERIIRLVDCTIFLVPKRVPVSDSLSSAQQNTSMIYKTIRICPLPVLEARGLRSRCRQGPPSSWALGEDPSCFFQLLGASGVPGLVVASLQPLPHLLLCVSPLLCHSITLVIAFRAMWVIQGVLTSRFLYLQWHLFQLRSHSQVLGLALKHIFLGPSFNPRQMDRHTWNCMKGHARYKHFQRLPDCILSVSTQGQF